jgi:isopentenyl diphosphate isomerase/L-lactate dehydrogenase-like FMN-dependent dehydrogenase
VPALLQIPGLVHHQHRVLAAEPGDHIGAQVITDPVVIPARLGQQMLQPVRRAVADMLGDRPAILPRQIRQQSQHQLSRSPSWLDPAKPSSDPIHQIIQVRQPPATVYAGSRGHRKIVLSRHKPRSSSGGRSTTSTDTPQDHEVRLEY